MSPDERNAFIEKWLPKIGQLRELSSEDAGLIDALLTDYESQRHGKFHRQHCGAAECCGPRTVSDALRDERVRPAVGERYGTHEIVVDMGIGITTVYRVWRDVLGELNIDRNDDNRFIDDWETCTLDLDELDATCTIEPRPA